MSIPLTVRDIASALSLTIQFATDAALSRPVTSGYAGDLLSWVMGRASPGAAWITIMSNINVAAVAVMADLPCVVLAEGVTPDGALAARALREDVALLGSDQSTFALCAGLRELLCR